MVSKLALEMALSRALETGADFAEFFIEDTISNSVSLIDGEIDAANTSRRHGAGLRLYQGLSSIYVHATDTSPEGLMRLAEQAAGAISGVSKSAIIQPIREMRARNISPITFLPNSVSAGRRSGLLHDAYGAAKSVSHEISQVSASIADTDTHVLIANSEGLYTADQRTYTRMRVSAIASGEGENQTGTEGPGAMMGYELFESRVDVEDYAKIAANRAVTMLHAGFCPAGQMPVVISGGFGGVIFHEACGHSLEATSVALNNSEFCGKLNQVIAAPCVTAIDNGIMPNEWGSINIDDEGMETTNLTLIEKGVLKNYMIDRLNGRRMNIKPTGSARRQDYTFAPTSRMRNTYIAPGSDDEQEMIRSMGDGLFAKSMGGGSVNPVTGEFNFSVAEGYLVKDGKIAQAVRGATLIGKGADVLMKIDRVGPNMWMAQGVCGSMSGSVPTNVGQPMIRVSSLTVGGRA